MRSFAAVSQQFHVAIDNLSAAKTLKSGVFARSASEQRIRVLINNTSTSKLFWYNDIFQSTAINAGARLRLRANLHLPANRCVVLVEKVLGMVQQGVRLAQLVGRIREVAAVHDAAHAHVATARQLVDGRLLVVGGWVEFAYE